MAEKSYDKLIRDRIPEIIEQAGKECEVQKLAAEEYKEKLEEKLLEEIEEYRETKEFEELADIMEVLLALVHTHGQNMKSLEEIRKEKREKRGAFEKQLLLV